MKKSKKTLVVIAGIVAALAVLLLIANNILENKLQKALEGALTQAQASYESLDVNLLNQSAEITQAKVDVKGKKISVAQASLQGIDIVEYIFNNKIIIGDLSVSEPHVLIEQSRDSSASKTEKKNSTFKQDVLIKDLTINNGDVKIAQQDSIAKFFTTFSRIHLQEVQVNKQTLSEPVPFKYKGYTIESDSLFLQMNDLHTLTIGGISANNGKINISKIRMLPKYSKTEHQQHIPYEKDRYELNIEELIMNDFSWEFQNDSLQFQNPFLELNNIEFMIYRDKRPPDDPRTKNLYSQMLRELPFKVGIDSMDMNNVYIKYSEKVHDDRPPGAVDFSNMHASVYNLTNIGMDKPGFPKTQIDVRTDLFQKAPLKVHWEFDVSDVSDRFQMSGNMGQLASEEINEFLKPAMNVQVSGSISDLVFDFSGNDDRAGGDLNLSYENFEVTVLKKNGEEKNNFLSTVANLFVKSETDSRKNFKDIEIARNKTKSFWNYLWIFVREGALKTFL
ncbi:hypothetical protein [Autumnicola musiva]|uniref:DUF748 domain-containing protein n=1 Tax=Autumnicola musiva TaxID=3075589 RepID=A0ABU3D0U3_9FLAO|nr:hypothetical protein [Zunongwangia sp. F117]MDT0675084.1 hypothetical protein [Zunongwangia sp. F117]